MRTYEELAQDFITHHSGFQVPILDVWLNPGEVIAMTGETCGKSIVTTNIASIVAKARRVLYLPLKLAEGTFLTRLAMILSGFSEKEITSYVVPERHNFDICWGKSLMGLDLCRYDLVVIDGLIYLKDKLSLVQALAERFGFSVIVVGREINGADQKFVFQKGDGMVVFQERGLPIKKELTINFTNYRVSLRPSDYEEEL